MKFLFDFFPIILFFAAYKVYGIYIATGVAIAASFVQVGLFWYRHRRFENMQLMGLALIAVFGGVTLLLHDEIFIKWKPTVLNWLLAAAFLGSQFIGGKSFVQRMMGAAVVLPDLVWRRLNLAWVIFFSALGAANLYVVYHFGTDIWVNFKLFGLMGLTFAFVIAQAVYIARHAKPGNGES